MFDLSTTLTLLLLVCLLCAIAFEFVNGFHDTANAVATVIYTNSLKPNVAVVWSGLCNFAGVFAGGIAVAMGIVNLLPVEALVDSNTMHSVSMVLALLLSAIIWNLGTWYVGLPASSSHALIGSILGVGIAYSFLPGGSSVAINWTKAQEIGLSLLISPFFGFACAIFLMFFFKRVIKNDFVFKEASQEKEPPMWVRAVLITTCSLVSFFHGSNDGQKGVGLVMLILIGIVPAYFAIDNTVELQNTKISIQHIHLLVSRADTLTLSAKEVKTHKEIIAKSIEAEALINTNLDASTLPKDQRFEVRSNIVKITKGCEKLVKGGNLSLSKNDIADLNKSIALTRKATDYAPKWVILMISLSLGLGTMIGWKRIVKTIGEKIGKQHMSYAQGASAEIVAAVTIGLSTSFGLPVSTTHVLSSGIAGSMVAKKGLKNLQPKTIKNILLAWVLTLPVTMLISGLLFLLFRAIL
ncbi:MAG: inorganic phosphate transporter [Bacteroidia bacterium]|nr:inorganic phosphate transporter [Bacteroidia bacterium]